MSGNRINIADKSTLDAVKTKVDTIDTNVASAGSKLGDSTNTASNTPSTIFSGLKYLINNVIESTNISTIMSRIGLNSDPPSSVPTSIFAGIKNIISNIDTVLSRQNTVSTKVDTLTSNLSAATSSINSSISNASRGAAVNKIGIGSKTPTYSGVYDTILDINTPGNLYSILAKTVSVSNTIDISLKVIIDGLVVYWSSIGNSQSKYSGILHVCSYGVESPGLVTTKGYFSNTQVYRNNYVLTPVPVKFNTLRVEVLTNMPGQTVVNYEYVLD